jgi:hypothetical protein
MVTAGTFAADVTVAALAGVAFSQIFMAVVNLIPWRSGENGIRSDGRVLLGLFLGLLGRRRQPDIDQLNRLRIYGLTQTRRFEEAAKLALSAAKTSVHPIPFIADALHCVSRCRGDLAAVNCYLEHADHVERAITRGSEEDLQSLPWLKANAAWSAMAARRDDLHDLIERFSREALESLPETPAMKGTRGAWLIENGYYDQGVSLLTDAVRSASDPLEKADYCIFLSRGWKALGDAPRSDGYQRLREHLVMQQSVDMAIATISA